MSFIESYKHLDKICGEMFETQYGVSAYIEEMLNNPHGSFLVRGWENDLKQLKHYRWIRNQIAHEPDCTEQNMRESGDAEWLDDFYSRIMNQTDPLTLYAKATAPKPTKKPMQTPKIDHETYAYSQQVTNPKKSSKVAISLITVLVVITLVVAAIFIISKSF
jgi:hypothetical protein